MARLKVFTACAAALLLGACSNPPDGADVRSESSRGASGIVDDLSDAPAPANAADTGQAAAPDLYAGAVSSVVEKAYREHQVDYQAYVEYLYFALGCGALRDEGAVSALRGASAEQLTMEAVSNRLPLPENGGIIDLGKAQQDGSARARAPSGCDYWKGDPSEVARLRQAAGAAELR